MSKYPFIVLEGIDGSGKTTLRNELWHELLNNGVPTIAMGQHSWLHPEYSEVLSQLRVSDSHELPPSNINQFIQAYCTDKYLHWKNSIESQLKECIVITDRYTLSDCVYLSTLYNINYKDILNSGIQMGLGVPDILVYLDLDPISAERRVIARGRETRHYERSEPLKKIREQYINVLESEDESNKLFSETCIKTSSSNTQERQDAKEQILKEIYNYI